MRLLKSLMAYSLKLTLAQILRLRASAAPANPDSDSWRVPQQDNPANIWRGHAAGKIAQREFSKHRLNITSVVIEQSDGSREFVNVGVKLDKSDAVTRSWVMKGLQTLLAEGRSVQIDLRLCGAARRVRMIDAVREQPSPLGG